MEGMKHKPPIRNIRYPEELGDVIEWLTKSYGAEVIETIGVSTMWLMNNYANEKLAIQKQITDSILKPIIEGKL